MITYIIRLQVLYRRGKSSENASACSGGSCRSADAYVRPLYVFRYKEALATGQYRLFFLSCALVSLWPTEWRAVLAVPTPARSTVLSYLPPPSLASSLRVHFRLSGRRTLIASSSVACRNAICLFVRHDVWRRIAVPSVVLRNPSIMWHRVRRRAESSHVIATNGRSSVTLFHSVSLALSSGYMCACACLQL